MELNENRFSGCGCVGNESCRGCYEPADTLIAISRDRDAAKAAYKAELADIAAQRASGAVSIRDANGMRECALEDYRVRMRELEIERYMLVCDEPGQREADEP